MKTTHKLFIEVTVTFDDWNENPKKILKKDLIQKVKDFTSSCYPMTQTILGNNSGELKIELNTIK